MYTDKFLQLANSAATPEQKSMFMGQHFRAVTRQKIESCRLCDLGGQGRCQGFSGKTPAFMSIVTDVPISVYAQDWVCEKLLPIVGYKREDVCFIPMTSCLPGHPCLKEDRRGQCRPNYEWQVSLASSRVFVLMGKGPASLIYGHEPEDLKSIRGSWTEVRNRQGLTDFMFVTDEWSGNQATNLLIEEDFKQLGSVLHYAWAVHMRELFPGAEFELGMSYEQICDVVANDVRRVLARVPEGKRSEEFMQIMIRICHDQTGLAVKALYDNDMARKCGIDISGPEWWTSKVLNGAER